MYWNYCHINQQKSNIKHMHRSRSCNRSSSSSNNHSKVLSDKNDLKMLSISTTSSFLNFCTLICQQLVILVLNHISHIKSRTYCISIAIAKRKNWIFLCHSLNVCINHLHTQIQITRHFQVGFNYVCVTTSIESKLISNQISCFYPFSQSPIHFWLKSGEQKTI